MSDDSSNHFWYNNSIKYYQAAAHELSWRMIRFDMNVPYHHHDDTTHITTSSGAAGAAGGGGGGGGQKYPVFQPKWDQFRALCGSTTPFAEAWNCFHAVLVEQQYETEQQLEYALLVALQKALGNACCRMVASTTDDACHCILFNDPSKKEWGFATQAPDHLTIPPNRRPKTGSSDSHYSDSSTVSSTTRARNGRFNHACVIYEKEEDESSEKVGTRIADVTVVINLKLSDTSCHPFHVRVGKRDWIENGGVLLRDPDLAYDHGPIAEELLYTLKTVVPCLVRNNIQPQQVPILVLAGRNKSKCDEGGSTTSIRLHFVQGALHIPDCFDGIFHYSISSGGGFDQYEQAIAAYIHTLYYGAIKAIQSTTGSNSPVAPAMLCSQEHKMDGYRIENCRLIASPIVGDKRSFLLQEFKVNQGELFRALLLGSFFVQCTDSLQWVAENIVPEESYPVIIKVSCVSVHDMLVEPLMAGCAFMKAKGCTNLADSLLGVWDTSRACLVTIMRDLGQLGFQELKPYTCTDHLVPLWIAFVVLVNRVLLPLAQKNIVHCDIRPGWDYTANIMMRKEIDHQSSCVIDLRLIDLESLAMVRDCSVVPNVRNSFHISYDRQQRSKTGLNFLWWQCLLIAYTWFGRKNSESIHVSAFVWDCRQGNIGNHMEYLSEKEKSTLSSIACGEEVLQENITSTLELLSEVCIRITKTIFP